ncbi:MAG: hypothetical protein GY869_20965, partial [Planctomycetes bacterium]|nr:hypothetical protein [Planctomycetota bacterium]
YTADATSILSWTHYSSGNHFDVTVDNKLRFSSWNNPSWEFVNSAQNIPQNIWTHITVTKSGNDAKIYINGVLDGQGTITSIPIVNRLSVGALIRQSGSIYFQGRIDEIRIWDVARSVTDIQADMHTTLDGTENGLVAYYRFDQISGEILPDLTANNNDGTLTNMDNTDWVISEAMPPFVKPATNVTSTGFKANWHPISGATGYRVDVSTDPNFGSFITNGQNVAAGIDSSFNVTGLTLSYGTIYYYRMRAEVGSWTSPSSAAETFMIRPGNALDFDGVNDFVELGNLDFVSTGTPGSYTVELWVNPR